MSTSTAVLIGVATLLLLTWLVVMQRHGPMQDDLTERVTQVLSTHAIVGLKINADGRDLSVSGGVPEGVTPQSVAAIAADVWGVRVVDVSGVKTGVSIPYPDDPLTPRFQRERIVRLGGDLNDPMDASSCLRTLARVASTDAIRFETGRASPLSVSYPLLNDLAAVVYQCPKTRLVIGGHTDVTDDHAFSWRLSEARAKAVEQYFKLAGIEASRMQSVAYGDAQPVASDATVGGRAASRRITFDILPAE